MKKLKYCRECKYGKVKGYYLRCFNPIVNANDYWALTAVDIPGTSAAVERSARWYKFPSCGMAGKLWEEKLDIENVVEI